MVAAAGTLKAKRPFVSAVIVLGWTVAAIVAVFIVAGIATATIFGDSDEAYVGLTIGLMLFAPIALLTGFTLAIKRFVKDRRAQRNQSAKTTGHADKNASDLTPS